MRVGGGWGRRLVAAPIFRLAPASAARAAEERVEPVSCGAARRNGDESERGGRRNGGPTGLSASLQLPPHTCLVVPSLAMKPETGQAGGDDKVRTRGGERSVHEQKQNGVDFFQPSFLL